MNNPSTILIGDNREVLKSLPPQHFHCAITSPPYFQLRSYLPADSPLKRFELGQEKTPADYIAALLETFTELWRVMRDDGTLWLNLGDSYAGSGKGPEWNLSQGENYRNMSLETKRIIPKGLKAKDLIGIPWCVAFALQAAGWYLRSDIIWAKPNCMPESVTDRPTRSHEYIFLLTKQPTYFYDAEAIRESGSMSSMARINQSNFANQTGGDKDYSNGTNKNRSMRKTLENFAKSQKQRGHSRRHEGFNDRWDQMTKEEQCAGTRNKRDVWFISPAQYSDAHFATFPIDLVTPCVLAGTSGHGCCESCGAPYTRIVEKGEPDREHQQACGGDTDGLYAGQATKNYESAGVQNASDLKRRVLAGMTKKKTVGWKPGCECGVGILPCRVIDPFCGTATVGEVCLNHRREFTGIDLNPEYQEMQKRRTSQASLI